MKKKTLIGVSIAIAIIAIGTVLCCLFLRNDVSVEITAITYSEELTDVYFISPEYGFTCPQDYNGEPYYDDELWQQVTDNLDSYRYYQVYYTVSTSRTIAEIEIHLDKDYGTSILMGDICEWYPTFEPGDNDIDFVFPLYIDSSAFSDEEIEDILSELQFTFTYRNTYGMINCDYILGSEHTTTMEKADGFFITTD